MFHRRILIARARLSHDSPPSGKKTFCMRNRIIQILLSFLCFYPLVGFAKDKEAASGESFITGTSPIKFTFPKGWSKNTKENPFDLQCFSKNERQNLGVFVFNKADMASTAKPLDTLMMQIEDMRSKRKNFREKEPLATVQKDNATFTTISFIGELDDSAWYYRYTLIDFKEGSDVFAIALQIGFPSEIKKNRDLFDSIIYTARPLAE
jgi:hypothetical protein